jgi:Mg-chelatase subunit ChlD
MRPFVSLALGCAIVATAHGPAAAATRGSELRLTLATPAPDSVIGSADGRVFVSGRALAHGGSAGRFDVVVVIDTSFSTHAPANADIDGDGLVGARLGTRWLPFLAWLLPMGNTDPDDSVLAAEVEATRTLLHQLDPQTTRVGVVSFSGNGRDAGRDARVEAALSSDYARVERALDRLLEAGPNGRTNIRDGIQVAATELAGGPDAFSETRADARKVMLFMSDGRPTLPVPQSPGENARLAVEAAQDAAALGIRIDTFAIGRSATKSPRVPVEVAAVSQGNFTPVRDPQNLIAVFEDIRLAEIERVEVVNSSTGESAPHVLVESDGHFAAVVGARDGANWIDVRARTTDGKESTLRVPVRLIPAATPQAMDARLLARRTRLFEDYLAELREKSVEIEAERDVEVLRTLQVEIERSRAEQREAERKLDLAVEDTPSAPRTAAAAPPAAPAGD